MEIYEVRNVQPYELDTWDAFVATSAGGTIFHTSVWQQVINQSYAQDQFVLIALWHQGQIVAGTAGLIRNTLGVSTLVTPLCTPYSGFILGESTVGYEKLLLGLQPFKYQHLLLPPVSANLGLFHEAGYQAITRKGFIINLQLSAEELWEGFESSTRRNIRKAERADYTISDQWDAEQAYQLFAQTFERQSGKCPVSRSLFDSIGTSSSLNEHRIRYTAWKDNTLQAYIVALRWNGTVYYELVAAGQEARSSGIPSLLIWQLIREHAGNGDWKHFDLVGGNIPAIARFKEGFGPQASVNFALEKNTSRRIRWGRAIRDLWRAS